MKLCFASFPTPRVAGRVRRLACECHERAIVVPLIVFFLLGMPFDAHARRGEAPISPVGRGSIGEPALNVDAPDVAALRIEDAEAKRGGVKTLRYAFPIRTALSPRDHGRWDTHSDGTRIWRLEVVGPGATDLNLAFETFHVPPGAKLWVISTEADYYEGPYTHEDNEEHGQLWVPVVPGERAIVEFQIPAKPAFEPELEMTQVGYGYIDLFSRNSLPKQQPCQNDVMCPEADPWRDQIRSVGVYSIFGSIACSGQMVMSADASFIPYFLSAYHCGVTELNAASVTVYWNFESRNCGDLAGGSLSENQTGAIFRARREDVDMSLIRLDDPPDPAHQIYFTGWDRSGNAPQGAVGIHHPNGDEKSISFDTDPLEVTQSCISFNPVGGTHWEVVNWEDGSTESGSSGSGIWDANSKLVVGFLSGGRSFCDVFEADCYGQLAVAWDGPTLGTRLRDWLDPANNGPPQVQGAYAPGVGHLDFVGIDFVDDCLGSSDAAVAPGESASLQIEVVALTNAVTGIQGVLSTSTPGVTITQSNSTWPDLQRDESAPNTVDFSLSVDATVPCLSSVALLAQLSDDAGTDYSFAIDLPVGTLQAATGLPRTIPDGNLAGVTRFFEVTDDFALADLDLRLKVDHNRVGDLTVELTSPAGTTVRLLDRPGVPASTYGCWSSDFDIVFDDDADFELEGHCAGPFLWYEGMASPTEALSAFAGESTLGTWTLYVQDALHDRSGEILEWELLTTPPLSAGTCFPCQSQPTTVHASTSATQRASLLVVPDGSGDRLDAAQFWDGIPGNPPTLIDATVTARVETAGGLPVEGFAATDLQWTSSANGLVLCADGGNADGPTDASGTTTFTGSIAGGGHSDLSVAERLTVNGNGLTTVYEPPSGLDITFNSPDMNGDLVVDLIDVGEFAVIFLGGVYDYAADFVWNGAVDLAEIGVLAQAINAECSTIPQRAKPIAAEFALEFDDGSRGVTPGQATGAWLVLRGPIAREGIHGWEASLRSSSNLKLISTSLVESSVNILGGPDFVVGTHAAGLRDASGELRLARLHFSVADDAPAQIYLDASHVGTGGAAGPALLSRDRAAPILWVDTAGQPLATVNPDREGTPSSDSVTRHALSSAPNPFNPSTEIHFALPRAGRAEIRIFDLVGRRVRSFDLGTTSAGPHRVVWHGRDEDGVTVGSGIYFSRLYVDGVAVIAPHKMSLLK